MLVTIHDLNKLESYYNPIDDFFVSSVNYFVINPGRVFKSVKKSRLECSPGEKEVIRYMRRTSI